MRKLFALIALAAAVFTACEGDNEVNYDTNLGKVVLYQLSYFRI